MSKENYMKIGVAVYCLAYNHEKYIRKTLEGFLMQKTNFPVKFIIHDDASTDNTAKIILEYKEKFPDIFDVIIQKDNLYSKNISIMQNYILPLIDTKYVACCEGDDYWIDSDKLQSQFEYMESHPDCHLCVHNTLIINENGDLTQKLFNKEIQPKDYSIEDIVKAKGGGLFHTSSYFYKTYDRVNMPEIYRLKGIGDYNFSIYLSTLGYVHYLPNVMSHYRTGSDNSWVKNNMRGEKAIAFNNRLIDWLKTINIENGSKFDDAFNYAIDSYTLDNYLIERDFYSIKKEKSILKIYKKLPMFTRLVFRLSCIKKKIWRT